jgi:hypothetical protein
MADPVRLGELMDSDFAVFDDGDDASMQQNLRMSGKRMAVLVDSAGQVCGVWSVVGRGTPIVASAETPAYDIADLDDSSSLMGELNRRGTSIVVLSEARPVGVVSAYRFAEYLDDRRVLRFGVPGEAATGDARLAGNYTQGRLVIVCKVCGTRNELRSWIEGVTRCANPAPPPHVLVRR